MVIIQFKAQAILQEANQQEAFQRGRNMAEEMRRNGIEELIDDVAGWGKAVYWKWMSWNKLQRPIFSTLPVALIMMSTKSWDWRSSVLNFHAVVTNPLQGDLILNLDLSGQKPSWKALNFAIFITIWMTSEQADIGLRYLYF